MWRGDVITSAGPSLLSVVDQIGTLNLVSPLVKPTLTTLGASAKVAWTTLGAVPGYVAGNVVGPSEAYTSGALALVIQAVIYPFPNCVFITGGLSSAPTVDEISIAHVTPLAGERCRKDNLAIADTGTPGFSGSLVLRDILWTWSGGVEEVYQDGILVAANAIVVATQNVSRFVMGCGADLTLGLASNIKFGEGRVGNVKLGLADAGAFHAYRLAYY
jgi:hypothetical protein